MSSPAPESVNHTPLYDTHVASGARMMAFGGWMLPVNFGSQVEEHHACRTAAAMFDVSHMTILDLAGSNSAASARTFLRHLLCNDVARLNDQGDALYTCMLQEDGGIIDDLIVYWRGGDDYRLILNAATRDKDLKWIKERLSAQATQPSLRLRDDLALVAVQGPAALARFFQVLEETGLAGSLTASDYCGDTLRRFSSVEFGDWFVGRTGYTGEDGLEVSLPQAQAATLWDALRAAGVQPAGLGARDTLRLESAMNLYGSDMDELFNPYESGIGWCVALSEDGRDFIGRSAMEDARNQSNGFDQQQIGLVLQGRGVLRGGQTVLLNEREIGVITSGSFSPTLEKSIALARVSLSACGVAAVADLVEQQCQVVIRDKPVDAQCVRKPFYKR